MIFKILEAISLGDFWILFSGSFFFVLLGGEKIVSLLFGWIQGLSLSCCKRTLIWEA